MASVDLNLLAVLDALLQEGSVTGAARRLHVTPPAVSRSLARLRDLTGDPILMRAGRRLVPTPMADRLRSRTSAVLADAYALLAPAAHPSDADIERGLDTTFTVRAGPDNAEGFGPALLRIMLDRAPRARLRLVEAANGASADLRDGRIDLSVGGPIPADNEAVHRDELLVDRFVIVGRVDGELARSCAGRSPGLADLARVRHVSSSRQGLLRGPLDDRLAEQGLDREVVASAPGFAATFALARHADLVCTAPERLHPRRPGHRPAQLAQPGTTAAQRRRPESI